MKILAINGSPHSGNTAEKIQQIERKLSEFADVEFETINLKDIELKPCKGCFQCFVKGEDTCPLNDDKITLAAKIEEADGVIFASPVYSMHISYLMKLFVDRFSYNFHRPRYFDKYAMTVAVTGNIGLKDTTKYLRGFASCWGFEVVGSLEYRAAPKNTPMRTVGVYKDQTDEVARRFYRTIKERKTRRLRFMDNLSFRMMQSMYARMETMSPYDYAYWSKKGWLEKEAWFFSGNARRNILKDSVSRFMAWMAGRQVDRTMAGRK